MRSTRNQTRVARIVVQWFTHYATNALKPISERIITLATPKTVKVVTVHKMSGYGFIPVVVLNCKAGLPYKLADIFNTF